MNFNDFWKTIKKEAKQNNVLLSDAMQNKKNIIDKDNIKDEDFNIIVDFFKEVEKFYNIKV